MLIGIVFDFFGAYLSGLWTYPDFSAFFYLKGIIFGYGFPMLMYYSAYSVVLHMLKYEFSSFGKKIAGAKGERRFFSLVTYLGIAATAVPLAFIPYSLAQVPRGLLFGFTLLGCWFILEGVEYRQYKRSLLKDMFEGYWNPLVAIIITAFITGLSWEFLNTVDYSWRYTNLPLSGVQIAGVPVAVIAGWVPLFVVYLSFYRAVFRKEKIF